MTEAEQYLNQIPMWASKKNTLEDIRAYLEELGNPDQVHADHPRGRNQWKRICLCIFDIGADGCRICRWNLCFPSSGGNQRTFPYKWGESQ